MTKQRFFVLLAVICSPAYAANDSEQEAPEVRRYTVEMIVFKYTQEVSVGTEMFVPELPPELPAVDVLIDPTDLKSPENTPDWRTSADVSAQQEFEQDTHTIEIIPLPEDNFTLNETYRRMQLLDVYEPIMHFGWTQPTLPRDVSEAMPLSAFATPPAGLDGELALYLGRFLHLEVKLQLDAPVSAPPPTRFDSFGVEVRMPRAAPPTQFRIAENRIVRNGELRYFDHPKFGVLAKISRVEEPEAEMTDSEISDDSDARGVTELLGDIPQ